MPIYEYVCEKCGKLNEVLQKVNEPPPRRCDGCGAKGKLTKMVSRSSFVLRGGGWYSDLYSSPKKPSATEGGKEKDGAPAPKKAETAPSAGGDKPDATKESSSSGATVKKVGK
jgi:putative FmdB family regulatory protein